jgi:glycosyltransferase involved in cell wall biosynthesis
MKPIAILHLRDTHEIGGPGKTILETHQAIDRSRFRLHLGVFVTRHESGDTPFTTEARRRDFPVHLIRGYNQYDPRIVWRVADLVKTLGIDIVHAHEVKSDVVAYLASRLHPVPIVTTLHGWIGNSAKQRLLTAMDRRIVRAFDRVIAVSSPIERACLAVGVRRDRLRLLHNAIVVGRYRRTGRRGTLSELVGRPLASPVLASIGRLSPEKGHADLIEAVGIVVKRGYKLSAVLVGDGPERSKLLDMVRMRGLDASVHLPGYTDHSARILEDVDLLVLPSHTEGLPNAALEALAMEVPVLATAVGGTPEVIADGVTGRLVPPHSPGALADAIVEFVSDAEPWRQMAKRGRLHVEANFDFQARTRRLEAIYTELVGRT